MTSYVYAITNKIDHKTYVGKSIRPKHRFSQHRWCKTSYLGRAIRLYGKENFLFQILEEYPTEEEAYEAEQFFIQYLNTRVPNGYNLETGGRGGKQHSVESKQKIGKANKGHKHTEETKAKIRETWKNKAGRKEILYSHPIMRKKRKPMSDATRIKMSLAKKGRPGHRKGTKHSEKTKRKIGIGVWQFHYRRHTNKSIG